MGFDLICVCLQNSYGIAFATQALTLSALRVISVKFLLVISLLYKTQWS